MDIIIKQLELIRKLTIQSAAFNTEYGKMLVAEIDNAIKRYEDL